MSRSTKAVLLSALVLPGAGHLYLKHYGRGIALITAGLACLWIVVDDVMRQASVLLAQITTDGGALDASRLSEWATQSASSSGSSSTAIASTILAGCWLVGIIDVYRLVQTESDE